MEKNQNNEIILARIILSHAPVAVAITDEEKSIRQYVTDFISENKVPLAEASILPIRIDCRLFKDEVSFWRGIAGAIKDAVPSDFEWSEDAMDAWDEINSSTDTYFLKEDIRVLAQDYLDLTKWHILLIFEEFECVLEKMNREGSLKFRSLTLDYIVMTVTRRPLRTIGWELLKEVYFCNQFVSFNI